MDVAKMLILQRWHEALLMLGVGRRLTIGLSRQSKYEEPYFHLHVVQSARLLTTFWGQAEGEVITYWEHVLLEQGLN